MAEQPSRKRRISKWASVSLVVAFALFTNYVLSEAPVYRFFGSQTGAPTGNNYRFPES